MEVQYTISWVTKLVLYWGKMYFALSRACDNDKTLSTQEKSNLRPSDSTLPCSTTEPQRLYGERGPLRSSYITRVLHTAKISDVDSVMFVNGIRKLEFFFAQ